MAAPFGPRTEGMPAPMAAQVEVDTRWVLVVQHSVHIDRPIEAVNAALIAGPRQWIPRLDAASHADGNARSAEARKKVAIDVGDL